MATPKHPFAKSYPKNLPWEFEAVNKPVYHLFEDSALQYPNRICIDFLGKTYTYIEIQGLINRFAAGLQELGVEKGHRVGLCLPNTPYFIIAYFAALRIGAIVVNFNPLLTAGEIAAQVNSSGTSVMVTINLTRVLNKISPLVNHNPLKHVVVCSLSAALPPLKSAMFQLLKFNEIARIPNHQAFHTYESLIVEGTHPKPVAIHPVKDIALLQYTGGTTGTPKAACLTHSNLSSNAHQIRLWLGKTHPEGERFLTLLPLFHVFALSANMHLALATGSTLVMLPSFNLPQLLATIRRTKPTIFPGVPTLFNTLATHKGIEKYDLSSIRWCVSGGAPLPAEVRQSFEKLTGATLVEGYGLTEASPVVGCNPRHVTSRVGSIGLPLPGTRFEIRDLKNQAKKNKTGQIGEVFVQGPQIMAGYWNNPAETALVLQKGWLRTGDVGFLDADGYLHLTERLKDIIITNGYNVYPRVIEEAAYTHPAVAEVTAIAIPDRHKGEVAKVFLTLKEDHSATEAELLAYLRSRLNPIERPAELEIRQSLPKTFTGKLSKKELVAEERQKRQ